MADNSLALGLAHHADDPQQDDSPAQGDEEGEPVPAMVDVDAQRVKDQAGAECPDDADHNVHQDARAAPLNDLAGEPAGDTADDDLAEPTYTRLAVEVHGGKFGCCRDVHAVLLADAGLAQHRAVISVYRFCVTI